MVVVIATVVVVVDAIVKGDKVVVEDATVVVAVGVVDHIIVEVVIGEEETVVEVTSIPGVPEVTTNVGIGTTDGRINTLIVNTLYEK